MPKFGIKDALLGYFWARIKKKLSYLKSTLSNLCNCKILQQRKKKQNLGPKFGYFCARIFKKLLQYLKSALSNLSNWKFFEKTKMSKFGTKNALFGFFLSQNFIKLSYLKSAPSNLSNCIISGKKILNLGAKMPYLGIFGLEFKKTITIF